MEADCLLTLLTEQRGKVSAIAKGVRKPNSRLRGGVQLFTHNEMYLAEGRNLDVVTQSDSVEAFTLLQENMVTISAACYWGELLEAFSAEGQADAELFQLALAGFHILCLAANEVIFRGLEIKLLSQAGYRPYWDNCVTCGKTFAGQNRFVFSAELGGVLCGSCSNGIAANCTQEAIGVWQQLLRMDLSKIRRLKVSAQGLQVLDQLMEEYLLRQLERPLKSRSVLKELLMSNTIDGGGKNG